MVLNNISTAITLDEFLEIETSKEYTIEERELKFDNDPDHKIIGVVLGVIENEKFVPVK